MRGYMTTLLALSIILHALVVLRGLRFMHKTKPLRGEDRNIVGAITAVSVMYLIGMATLLFEVQFASSDPDLGTAHAFLMGFSATSACLFLAIVGCYANYIRRRRGHG